MVAFNFSLFRIIPVFCRHRNHPLFYGNFPVSLKQSASLGRPVPIQEQETQNVYGRRVPALPIPRHDILHIEDQFHTRDNV
jgi:hypothetical protein